MACRVLGIPNTTMFDYEFARLQHSFNCRLANRVLIPAAIRPSAWPATGHGRRSWCATAG